MVSALYGLCGLSRIVSAGLAGTMPLAVANPFFLLREGALQPTDAVNLSISFTLRAIAIWRGLILGCDTAFDTRMPFARRGANFKVKG